MSNVGMKLPCNLRIEELIDSYNVTGKLKTVNWQITYKQQQADTQLCYFLPLFNFFLPGVKMWDIGFYLF